MSMLCIWIEYINKLIYYYFFPDKNPYKSLGWPLNWGTQRKYSSLKCDIELKEFVFIDWLIIEGLKIGLFCWDKELFNRNILGIWRVSRIIIIVFQILKYNWWIAKWCKLHIRWIDGGKHMFSQLLDIWFLSWLCHFKWKDPFYKCRLPFSKFCWLICGIFR